MRWRPQACVSARLSPGLCDLGRSPPFPEPQSLPLSSGGGCMTSVPRALSTEPPLDTRALWPPLSLGPRGISLSWRDHCLPCFPVWTWLWLLCVPRAWHMVDAEKRSLSDCALQYFSRFERINDELLMGSQRGKEGRGERPLGEVQSESRAGLRRSPLRRGRSAGSTPGPGSVLCPRGARRCCGVLSLKVEKHGGLRHRPPGGHTSLPLTSEPGC